MKTLITSSVLLLVSQLSYAQNLSDANPVTRALTLQDGELAVGAGISYGKTKEGESKLQPGFAVSYGLSENLTVGPVGARYSLLSRYNHSNGLEIAAEAGLMGWYDAPGDDKSIGLGAGISGKYVFNEKVAATFDVAYIHWNEDNRDNRQEFRVSLGGLLQVQPGLTVFANAQYRELKDFEQNHAYGVATGLMWTASSQLDITLSAGYSDFDPVKSGYKADVDLEKQVGVSVLYRF
jgi:hypothetical protein